MNNSSKKTTSNNIIEMFLFPAVDAILEKKVKEAFNIKLSQSKPLNFQMLKGGVEHAKRDFWKSMFHNPEVVTTQVLEKYESCDNGTFLVISKSYVTELCEKIMLCGLYIDCEGEIEYSMYSPEVLANGYWEKCDLEAENETILNYLYLLDDWYLVDDEEEYSVFTKGR